MIYIKSNHISNVAFNNFVPTVTKENNKALVNQLFLIGAVVLITWLLFKDYPKSNIDIKEEED